jgi:hypothetical protein
MLAGPSGCRLDSEPEPGRSGKERLATHDERAASLDVSGTAGAGAEGASDDAPPMAPEDPPPEMPTQHVRSDDARRCEREKQRCDDDDACTVDHEMSDDQECGVECVHTPITQPHDDDGCCPPGADFERDSDCTPAVCGNHSVEPGEECDDGGACTSACQVMAGLIHRYSFDGAGTAARDSVGEADGRLVNTTLRDAGEADLRGNTSDQYVELPAALISTLQDTSVEAWVTWRGGPPATAGDSSEPIEWQRVFDFGSSTAADGWQADGQSYLFMTVANEQGSPRLAYKGLGDPQEVQVTASRPFPVARRVHVVSVFDDADDRLLLYIDGVSVGSAALRASLSSIRDVNNWLGRSQFAVDREFNGSFGEFRIYDRALTADQVREHFSAGPDP